VSEKGVIHHIGVSGGKDSTALLLWAVYESGLQKEARIASFCDTGNEAQETYEYVRFLSAKIESEGVAPIHWITPPLDFYELAVKKRRFPSAKARFCTYDLKIIPSSKYVASLMADGSDVIALSGVRAAESEERAKYPEREWSAIYDCEVWRPLLSWTLQDVWAIHARYGVPRNPLYDKGCQRVGCLPCVMSRKEEIYLIGRQFPERVDRIRQAESEARTTARGGATFFPSDKIPLRYRTSETWQRPGTTGIAANSTPLPPTVEADAMEGQLFNIAPAKAAKRNARFNRFALAMIDDVMRWAESEGSVHQISVDTEELEEPPTCESRLGMCE